MIFKNQGMSDSEILNNIKRIETELPYWEKYYYGKCLKLDLKVLKRMLIANEEDRIDRAKHPDKYGG